MTEQPLFEAEEVTPESTVPVLHFPDIYSGDAGINFSNSYFVIAKATEGVNYRNPDYASFKEQAVKNHVQFVAYHFLHHGSIGEQAANAFGIVGKSVPLAVDVEPTGGSIPTVADAEQFIDAYRKLGGIVYLTYLPHWHWVNLGTPVLSGLRERGQYLWTSDYTTYSDTGPGWTGYGGLKVAIWQYADNVNYGGEPRVDFNAYKGIGVSTLAEASAQLMIFLTTGKFGASMNDTSPPAPPVTPPVTLLGHVAYIQEGFEAKWGDFVTEQVTSTDGGKSWTRVTS